MSSINVEQLLTVSAGKALALRGAYVTACHWLPDLEANSCSSGFYASHFISFFFSPLLFPPKSSVAEVQIHDQAVQTECRGSLRVEREVHLSWA